MTKVNFTSHKDEIMSEYDKTVQLALEAIGLQAEAYAKKDTNMPVDTGRARNSITWATKKQEGKSFKYKDNNGKEYTDSVGKGAKPNSVYLGSNVEYFPFIELGSSTITARHVLQAAATGHENKYKELFEAAFESLK